MRTGIFLTTAAILIGTTGVASAALMSDYTVAPPGDLVPEGTYALSTSSNQFRGDNAWGDYTSPHGSAFYVFNGSPDTGARVFYGSVDLTAGEVFSVSFLAVDNYPISAPVLQLADNGVLVGNAVTLTPPYGSSFLSGVGPWQKVTLSFTPSSSSTDVLSLIDTNIVRNGNDFSLAAVPEPATWAMLLLGFTGVGLAGYRSTKRKVSIEAA